MGRIGKYVETRVRQCCMQPVSGGQWHERIMFAMDQQGWYPDGRRYRPQIHLAQPAQPLLQAALLRQGMAGKSLPELAHMVPGLGIALIQQGCKTLQREFRLFADRLHKTIQQRGRLRLRPVLTLHETGRGTHQNQPADPLRHQYRGLHGQQGTQRPTTEHDPWR